MVRNCFGIPSMKFQRLASLSVLLLAVSMASAIESFEPPRIFGRIPPTKHWIWYVVAGPRNGVAPVVYISTGHFRTAFPEELIVVSSARFNILARFTKARLAKASCPFEVNKPLPYYAVQISEHRDGHTSSCMLSQASACDHIAEVTRLPGMDWSPAELKIFDDLARGDQCRSSSVPP
jgi:hypothetical protein